MSLGLGVYQGKSADLQKKLSILFCLLFSAFCKQSAEYELIYGRDDEKNNTAISYTFKHLASYSLLQGFCCVIIIQQDFNNCCIYFFSFFKS